MLIEFEDGSPFARGSAEYNTVPGYEYSDQVFLMVEFEGNPEFAKMWEAVVHTDANYLICSPKIAAAIIEKAHLEVEARVRFDGTMVEGKLYSGVILTLLDSDSGESVPQAVWAFVPDKAEDLKRDKPEIFLGMKRCLDQFVFAIDPWNKVFYFG